MSGRTLWCGVDLSKVQGATRHGINMLFFVIMKRVGEVLNRVWFNNKTIPIELSFGLHEICISNKISKRTNCKGIEFGVAMFWVRYELSFSLFVHSGFTQRPFYWWIPCRQRNSKIRDIQICEILSGHGTGATSLCTRDAGFSTGF